MLMSPLDVRKVLEEIVHPQRQARLEAVLRERTRYLTLALEDLYQPHNAAAVLRSADAFGIQDVHTIEHQHRFRPSEGVAVGADRWLSLFPHTSLESCYSHLRKKGYRIVVTSPHSGAYNLETLPLDQPTAIVFGSEKPGASDAALQLADAHLKVEMRGFVESLNISVCAALCLSRLSERIRAENQPWNLSKEEQDALHLQWLTQSVPRGEEMIRGLQKRDQLEPESCPP